MATEFDDDILGDEEGEELFHVGLYTGVVTNNEDPLLLGRCKIRIPGLIDPESAWALPASVAGGIAGRGIFDVPDVGSDVFVQFIQGDIEQPMYWGGNWGIPDSGRETPFGGNFSKEDRVKLKCWETSRFLLLFDERSGGERLVIRDKNSGHEVVLVAGGVRLGSESASEAVIRGNQFLTALNTLVDAINTFAGTAVTTPQGPPATALSAAITVFKQAAQQALSVIVKTS